MSANSDALEQATLAFIGAQAALGARPTPRRRAEVDHAFACLAALAAPRIRYFIRRYGLTAAAEDAEQVCAIALHRAAASYDPRRARFTTHMNWQIRAELQALRYRLHGDQRRAAHRLAAETLSLDEPGIFDLLADPVAEWAVEDGAAGHLAERFADQVVDDWVRPRTGEVRRTAERRAAQRALVRRQLTATEPASRLAERDRHIVRRAFSDIAGRVNNGLC